MSVDLLGWRFHKQRSKEVYKLIVAFCCMSKSLVGDWLGDASDGSDVVLWLARPGHSRKDVAPTNKGHQNSIMQTGPHCSMANRTCSVAARINWLTHCQMNGKEAHAILSDGNRASNTGHFVLDGRQPQHTSCSDQIRIQPQSPSLTAAWYLW